MTPRSQPPHQNIYKTRPSPLYWHDTRRVLFSDYKYRVLGRLVHDGAKSSWSAVKLTDVLKDVNVELSDTINSLGPMFLKALQEGEDGSAGAVATRARFVEILPYAREVAEVAALSWTASLENKITEAIPQSTRDELNAETWRKKQLAISDVIFSNTFNLVSPQILATVRQNHSLPAIDSSRLVDQGSNAPSAETQQRPSRTYLELEIIAIYW
jgi:hypothetical protein